jgi:biopolymer transport protein ExbD/biopolymer transport protein TolR
MGMFVGGKRGIVSEMNVVPLIDILLVLLVIFMIIPAHNKGEEALVPQQSTQPPGTPPREDVVVIQVLADGTLRINQEPVSWDRLGARIAEVFKLRATRVAFIRGDGPVEFGVVANVIDVMHTSGIASVGLLTPDLEKGL